MKNITRKALQAIFVILGIPIAIIRGAQAESRLLYVCYRYPNTKFSHGCNANDECTFGEKVRIFENTTISNTHIGNYTYVGGQSELHNCIIGRYCSIGSNVKIGLGIHPVYDVISTFPGFYSKNETTINFNHDATIVEYKYVIIGNDVWIGARSMIMDGVVIGDGAVIAAGSIVTKNVDAYTVVGGIPAKLIRRRFSENDAQKLINFAWWNKDTDFCKQHAALFMKKEDFFDMIDSEEK